MVAATVLQRFPMDRDAAPAFRTLPHNTEAEKALLGVIFVDNRAYGAVAQFLKPEHFAEVAHQRIFEAIKDTVDTGGEANPITLNGRLAQDDLLADIGGIAYLAELMTCAVSVMNAGEYGRIVVEDFSRLKVIEAAEDAVNAAYPGRPERRRRHGRP